METPEMVLLMKTWRQICDGLSSTDIELTKLYDDVYKSMARDLGPQVRIIVEELSDPQNLPALIHCSMGKDRTGFVAALILTTLGVPYSEVIQDYLLTNSCIHAWVEQLVLRHPHPDILRRFFETQYEFLDTAYQTLKANHGSLDDYMMDVLGLSESRIDVLRGALLEGEC